MKLEQLIPQYIGYRKSLGEKFKTNETYLKAFCKAMGPSRHIKALTKKKINDFLYGRASITSGWFIKHSALLGFYKYALARNYITQIPLPDILPKRPPPFVPYIYSNSELKRLFDTALTYQVNRSHIAPYMVRTLLILTYALGLRLHETLSITLGDIDMDRLVITIQQSKFYKSRLVPFNQQIKKVMNSYLHWRIKQGQSRSPDTHLFIGKNNQPANLWTIEQIFKRIREKAGIERNDKARYQPRLHDLRHTFAVNRLVSWYQENKNVQQLLPVLSVYLGHKYLAHTTVYLTMTDNLLDEAKMRFEKYAKGEQQ
ncbi:tyrosine-type recombinase/integrase [Ferruginibacter sp.]|nr:tyrosine-type recombinase/integrase [Ferruginibacter sp.]